jgi:hypothetical protein
MGQKHAAQAPFRFCYHVRPELQENFLWRMPTDLGAGRPLPIRQAHGCSPSLLDISAVKCSVCAVHAFWVWGSHCAFPALMRSWQRLGPSCKASSQVLVNISKRQMYRGCA